MKIKVTQLKDGERDIVAKALYSYAQCIMPEETQVLERYKEIGNIIRHGELLLCEYQYQNGEEEK